MMKSQQFFLSLVVLVLAGFIWGCAASPVVSPVPAEPGPDKVRPKKSIDNKKKKTPTQTGVAQQKPVEPVLAEPTPEKNSEEESVVGRPVFYYDYYPDAEVYYDTIRHLYFYPDNGSWIMSVALPTAFQQNIGLSVRLRLQTALPYSLHQEHRVAYPPDPARRGF